MFAGLLAGTGFKMALVAGAVALLGAFYVYHNNVVNERDAALQQVGALTVANEIQDETIKALVENTAEWSKSAEKFQITLQKMTENQEKSNEHSRKLNDVLSKHNLYRLSLAKPGLIERRINRGTVNVLKLFESTTSGSTNSSGRDRKTTGKTGSP